jgi:hypothetical protein
VLSASKAADLSELEVNIKIDELTSGAGAANAVEVAGVGGSDSVAMTGVVEAVPDVGAVPVVEAVSLVEAVSVVEAVSLIEAVSVVEAVALAVIALGVVVVRIDEVIAVVFDVVANTVAVKPGSSSIFVELSAMLDLKQLIPLPHVPGGQGPQRKCQAWAVQLTPG